MDDPSTQSLLDQEPQQEDNEKPPDCSPQGRFLLLWRMTKITGGQPSGRFFKTIPNVYQLNRFDLCAFTNRSQKKFCLGKVTQ
jgi:hypothetical protein